MPLPNPTIGHRPDCPCRLCWHAKHSPRYQVLWGIPVVPQNTPAVFTIPAPSGEQRNTCVYLGEDTGHTVNCSSCRGTVRLKLMGCKIYGACTTTKKVPDHHCCVGCDSYEPKPQDQMTTVPSGPTLNWEYGITTVPARMDTYLPITIESLKQGGFDKPRLFIDGVLSNSGIGLTYYQRYQAHLGLTFRYPKLNCWGNFIHSLHELYTRNPGADRYAMFQDDIICSRNLKRYLELVPMPNGGQSYLNLYTFRENESIIANKPTGFVEATPLNTSRGGGNYHGKQQQAGRSASALVFTAEGVRVLLSSRHSIMKGTAAGQRGWRFVDGGVVEAMNQANYWEHVHNPSLVQHIGDLSTLGNRNSKATTFLGEGFDCLTLLTPSHLRRP